MIPNNSFLNIKDSNIKRFLIFPMIFKHPSCPFDFWALKTEHVENIKIWFYLSGRRQSRVSSAHPPLFSLICRMKCVFNVDNKNEERREQLCYIFPLHYFIHEKKSCIFPLFCCSAGIDSKAMCVLSRHSVTEI